MMCPKCGNLLAEGSRYCPFCGSSIEAPAPAPTPVLTHAGGEGQPPADHPPYPQQPNGQPFQQNPNGQSFQQGPYGQPFRQNPYGQPYPGNRPVPADPLRDPRGMKWFKFIIYFQLFANAALNGYAAITAITGAHYQGKADMVYTVFPGLRPLDIVYALLLLGMVALAIVARMRLARFRRNGPTLYYILLIANSALSLLYLLAVSAVSGISLSQLGSSNTLVSLGINMVMLIVNVIYFGKRSDLFVN